MSENGAVTTTTRPEDPEEKTTMTDGVALPGMEVRVLDASGAVAPAGEEGQLQVRGCSNFIGYLRRPELDPKDADGWFDTGDLARMDEAGYIRIAGRSKDIIIRGGENIPVVEVEGLLFKHPAVAAVAIVGYPTNGSGNAPAPSWCPAMGNRSASSYGGLSRRAADGEAVTSPSGSRLSANSRARPAARSRSSGFAKLSATADRGSAAPTNHNNQGRTA